MEPYVSATERKYDLVGDAKKAIYMFAKGTTPVLSSSLVVRLASTM